MSASRNCFFPEATTYPDFFNHNLTDDNRVLKVVSGGYCWARAFYYQLLKVIFEFETEEQNPINYGQMLLKKSKETIQRIPDSQSDHIFASYLPILNNFIEKLSQNSEISFEDYINSHPEIDEALINILSLMLSQSNYVEASTQQKIKYLGEIFEETMYQFQKGVKFEQSDTFLYFDRQDKVYIAFLNYVSDFDQYQPDAGSKEDTVSIQKQTDKNKEDMLPSKKISNKQQKEGENGRGGHNQGYEYVTTSIIPIRQTVQAAINTIIEKQEKKQSPVQYLFQNRFRSNSNSIQPSNPPSIPTYSPASPLPQQIKSPFDNVKESLLPTDNREQQVSLVKNMDKSENSNSNSNHMEFTLGKKNEDIYGNKFSEQSEESLKILNTIQVKRTETIEDINDADYYKYKKRTSDVVQRKINDFPRSSVHHQDSDVFYKPISNRNVPNQVGKPAVKKDPLDICNDSEKGTFYRKFTDTRILNLLSEPYRTKVKMLKNRFIGVHSRGYRSPVYEQQQF